MSKRMTKAGWIRSLSDKAIVPGESPEGVAANYYYRASVQGETLVVDIYKINAGGPFIRAFQHPIFGYATKQGSRDATVSTLINALPVTAWGLNEKIPPAQTGDEATVNAFFGAAEGLFNMVNAQADALQNKRQNRYEALMLRSDQLTESMGDLPEDFDEWIERDLLKRDRFIYYSYTGRKRQIGLCTACKEDVVVEGAKNNKKGVCPHCGAQVLFKARDKAAPFYINFNASALIRDNQGRLVHRIFSITHTISKRAEKIETRKREFVRNTLDKNLRSSLCYEWRYHTGIGQSLWCDSGPVYHLSYLYPHNIDEVIPKDMHIALKEIARKEYFVLSDYVRAAIQHPELEYIVKHGLTKIALHLCRNSYQMNHGAKSLAGYLKLSPEYVQFAKKYNADAPGLNLLQQAYASGVRIREEDFAEYLLNRKGTPSNYVTLLKYMRLPKMYKYIKAQFGIATESHMIGSYADYVRMCEELGFDLTNDFILFPRNLRQAHDEVTKLLDIKKIAEKNESIKAISSELEEKYKVSYKGYVVIVPRSAQEIVQDGQALRHCVKSYIDRMIDRELDILFIRKEDKPDESYATVEIRSGEIIQARGARNEDKTKELKPILDRLKKKLTA